jgi:hypothetical protein
MLSMSEIEQALRRATAGGAWRRAYEDGESWLKKWCGLMRAVFRRSCSRGRRLRLPGNQNCVDAAFSVALCGPIRLQVIIAPCLHGHNRGAGAGGRRRVRRPDAGPILPKGVTDFVRYE